LACGYVGDPPARRFVRCDSHALPERGATGPHESSGCTSAELGEAAFGEE